MKPRSPHVAVLIETSRSYGRELLSGVRSYLSDHGPWSVFMQLRSLDSSLPPWLQSWDGDGIIARISSDEMYEAIEGLDVPVVELRMMAREQSFPFVGVDNASMGRIVAEHFMSNGLRHFGVFRNDSHPYFRERCDNFIETVHQAGYQCQPFNTDFPGEAPEAWERSQQQIAAWLTSLPKPIGIMACTDQLGFWLLDACRRAGLNVPDEVAVVGAENDESLCAMATPTMSSVAFGGDRVGYRAAELLDEMMAGGPAPRQPILFDPLGIVVRTSSDSVAIEDEDLARAALYIRDHATEGIRVADVLTSVAVSRSHLERGFREHLGRTPNQEILRRKLQAATTILRETDDALKVVAVRCGFRHTQNFVATFKQHFDITPGEYRRRLRAH